MSQENVELVRRGFAELGGYPERIEAAEFASGSAARTWWRFVLVTGRGWWRSRARLLGPTSGSGLLSASGCHSLRVWPELTRS